MSDQIEQAPGLGTLAGRLASTGAGALRNRMELLALEWQEERARRAGMIVRAFSLLFLALMGAVLLTATIIFLLPEELRLYAAGGFSLLYLLGALSSWLALRSLLNREPFAESLDQFKKDCGWLDESR